jgi:superfamily II DNA/RNA helicase
MRIRLHAESLVVASQPAYLLPLLTACFEAEGAALAGTGRRTTDHVLGIVVAPSQELAIQIVRQAEALLGPAGRQYVAQAIGGANMRRQLDALRRNKPMLVVGTPGRLAELSLLGHLRTHHVRSLVIDEADELLDAVFARHLARLQEHAGKAVYAGRQTVLVSATLTPRTLAAYAPWCPAPEVVTAATPAAAVPRARALAEPGAETDSDDAGGAESSPPPALPKELLHNYVIVDDARHRVDLLRRSIYALGACARARARACDMHACCAAGTCACTPWSDADALKRRFICRPPPTRVADSQRALVFLNFGRRLADTAQKLSSRGMPVGALHGGLNKTERAGTLSAFRAGKLRALLVTDLAARGLDVPECDAVFNLELPSDGVHYAHRAGRTARAGRAGRMVTLVEPRQVFVLRKFERFLGIDIAEAKVYAGEMTPAADAAADAAAATVAAADAALPAAEDQAREAR